MTRMYATALMGRDGSATVYELLEYAYVKEYGSVMPEIKKTPAGKPYFPNRPDVHFSLSHSRTHVLCAISEQPIGVDIESERHVTERAVRFFASPEELAHFDPLDLWVLKESYIKLVGGKLLMVKTIHFSKENDIIVPPDKRAIAKLYHIGNNPAAASSYSDHLPSSIELT